MEKSDPASAISETALSFLTALLRGMRLEAEVDAVYREDCLVLSASCGEDSHIAIGRKGQTLEALQFLLLRMVAMKHPETRRPRLLVDIDGYRERRRLNLIDMARRTAEEVLETGEAVRISPLNSYERHLVHSSLKDVRGVSTTSLGDGQLKEILVELEGDTI